MSDVINVVVTGLAWMGGGVGAIESALEQIFRDAEQEILLSVYAISNSVDLLFSWLESALDRGVLVRFIINHLRNQPDDVVTRLENLAITYGHFYLYNFGNELDDGDLHAKAVVADRKLALIGSSNMSRRGLLVNHELAVFVRGQTAASVAGVIDRLAHSQKVTRITGPSINP